MLLGLFPVFLLPSTLACGSSVNLEDTQIINDPTLSFMASPPVSWTYFPVITGAAGTAPVASWFPGQSETQADAFQAAQNDILAAVLEAFNSGNIRAEDVTTTVTYTPDMIMNCFLTVMPPVNSMLGRVAAGAVTDTAIVTGTNGATTAFTMCPPPANAMGLAPFQPYIKPVQVVIRGYSATRYRWRQIAANILSILNSRYRVLFRSEITVASS
uniref:Secreted protein n=1 Tax=Steinernema glaseri TaxID=37863 RepID=A0A1I7ZDN7_9BILA